MERVSISHPTYLSHPIDATAEIEVAIKFQGNLLPEISQKILVRAIQSMGQEREVPHNGTLRDAGDAMEAAEV